MMLIPSFSAFAFLLPPPFPHSRAVSIITKDAGTHFDPKLAAIFIDIQEEFRQIALELAETAEEREALNN